MVHKTAEWGKPCLLFETDIEKTFDSLSWEALLETLWEAQCEQSPHESLALVGPLAPTGSDSSTPSLAIVFLGYLQGISPNIWWLT